MKYLVYEVSSDFFFFKSWASDLGSRLVYESIGGYGNKVSVDYLAEQERETCSNSKHLMLVAASAQNHVT